MTPESSSYQGQRVPSRGRKAPIYQEERVCDRCDTKLSRYNRGPTCYRHKPKRRPRLRGQTEEARKEDPTYHKCKSCAQRERYWRTGARLILLDELWHREGTNGKGTLCEEG